MNDQSLRGRHWGVTLSFGKAHVHEAGAEKAGAAVGFRLTTCTSEQRVQEGSMKTSVSYTAFGGGHEQQ